MSYSSSSAGEEAVVVRGRRGSKQENGGKVGKGRVEVNANKHNEEEQEEDTESLVDNRRFRWGGARGAAVSLGGCVRVCCGACE